MNTHLCRAAGLLALAAIAASPAAARSPALDRALPDRSWGYESQDPPEGFQPRLSAEAGVLCVKQCPNDQLPCDPPSYKVADGRCSTEWH